MAVTPATIIKLGGDILRDIDGVQQLGSALRSLVENSTPVLIVHGGGPQATALSKRLGIAPNIVAGRRITDQAALDVMKMAVAGQVNVDLCASLYRNAVPALGICGASAGLVQAVKRPPRVVAGGGDQPIDFGRVGDIVGVNQTLIRQLLSHAIVPVISCLGADETGNVYNINADIVATRIAIALKAQRLYLLTASGGVRRDVENPSSIIEHMTIEEAKAAIDDGTISGGMLPKLAESFVALERGVEEIIITSVGGFCRGERSVPSTKLTLG